MDEQLQRKYDDLIDYLRGFEKVGVACSGGVDSTFLANCCCQALGAENVIVVFGDSDLQSTKLRQSIEERLARDVHPAVRIEQIQVDPFSNAAFVKNPRDRCYICKTHIFKRFLEVLADLAIDVLCDGTNCDDLQDDRPGLKALEELGVVSPLVQTGFTKQDIRNAAASLGLQCADLPSNSCLATRIETDTSLDPGKLQAIEAMEDFLHGRGYHGCRVRPRAEKIILEFLAEDINRVADPLERRQIMTYFQDIGYHTVLLDLKGRAR